jgi:tetratricopeptide (TPR) repeat protein
MPQVSWSDTIKERAEHFLRELLAYVLDFRDDYRKLQYCWKEEVSHQAKLLIESPTQDLKNLGRFANRNHFYEVRDRLEDLGILDNHSTNTKYKGKSHFTLKLWSKDVKTNIREFNKAWENQQQTKSKQIALNKVDTLKRSIPETATLSEPPSNIPLTSIQSNQFVGRSDTLEQLHQLLQENKKVAITAIAGMGGVGKTELAIQYTLKHKEDYSGGVCWLSASASDIASQIIEFATTYFPNFVIPDGVRDQVRFCWKQWRQPGIVLIILDDVTDFQKIKPHLPPQSSQFKILCTTRERFGSPFIRIDLDVLKPLAAMQLLKSLIGRERLRREPWKAKELCRRLGYLPLALELVGRYLADLEDVSIEKMLSRLESKGLSHRCLEETKPEMRYTLGVSAAFSLSWENLDTRERELGCFLSLFASAPIPLMLLDSTNIFDDADELQVAKARLIRLNLLKREGDSSVQLHSLIREYFKQELQGLENADQLRCIFTQAMSNRAKDFPRIPTRKSISNITSAIPHIEEAAQNFSDFLGQQDLEEPFIFVTVARFYKYHGLSQKIEFWFEQCLSITEKRLGSDHPTVAMSLSNLGSMYINEQHQAKASEYLTKAIEIYNRLPGLDPDFGVALNSLASLRDFQQSHEEALSLYEQSIKYLKAVLGADHHYLADILNNWADLCRRQGQNEKAINLLMEASRICHVSQDVHPLKVSKTLNNLGLNLFHHSYHYWAMSEIMYMMALDIRLKFLEDDHLSVAEVLNNIGCLYYAQGFPPEAKTWLDRALEIHQSKLGVNHPETIKCLRNLERVNSGVPLFSDNGKNPTVS